ncbi:MAG TPA: hypothetical protein VM531_01705 [Sphingomicrobium sp.]|jgi:hypothetical protein|nr:hypothetical protein [Sphingomicrobium sp.]
MTQGRSKGAGPVTGVIVTGILTVIFAFYAADMVVRFCPRGEDCETIGRVLFGVGMVVSFAIAGSLGLATKDLVERWQRRG